MADSLEIVKCPACGKNMYKFEVPSKDFFVDICIEGCGGIFFDNREFRHFDEQHEDIDVIIEALKTNDNYKPVQDEKRICPACSKPMVKHFATPKGQVTVDECYSCGAIFLDHGELLKIRSLYKNEQECIDDFNKLFSAKFSSEFDTLEIESVNKKGTNKIYKHYEKFWNFIYNKFN